MILCGVMLESLLITGLLCAVTRIRYEIDARYVRVIWFGFTVRKIALTDIADVHTRFRFWNEHWCNTVSNIPNRRVTLHRKSGFVRNFVITPKNREAFLAVLRARLNVTTG
jgi:hypothetical protein